MVKQRITQLLELADQDRSDLDRTWNTLCWFGSIYGFADSVVDEACMWAIELADAEYLPWFADSCALARALTGDIQGALEDYDTYLTSAKANNTCKSYCEIREVLKERLEAGEDPTEIFDAQMLEALKNE